MSTSEIGIRLCRRTDLALIVAGAFGNRGNRFLGRLAPRSDHHRDPPILE